MTEMPICEGTAMPLLEPPIPKHALERNTSLAIYVNVSNKPGPFQWSCKYTNDQVNDDLLLQYLAKVCSCSYIPFRVSVAMGFLLL